MNKIFTVLKYFLLSALMLFILVFIGYQIYSAVYSPYQTETVVSLNHENKIEVDGMFLRTEEAVEANHQNYIVHYLHSDGKKVGAGGTVAELYSSENDILNYEKIKELNELVELLKESQDQSSVLVTNADQITNQINSRIKELSIAVYNHDYEAISDCKNDIQILLNRRNIITEKEKDFNEYISQVNNQISSLKKQIKNPLKAVKATKNGNFVINVDGYEESAQYSEISSLSALDIESYIETSKPDDISQNTIGKLITNFDWYYCFMLPIDDNDDYNERIKVGTNLKMRFNDVSSEILPVSVSKVVLDDVNGKMAVFVKSNYLTGKFCSARKEKADIIFSSVKGYKIKKSAVRIENEQKGVYVVIGKQMFFRKIDVIYEEKDYVVCRIESGSGTLKPFDDVIVKGTDLKNGKTLWVSCNKQS